MHDCIWENESEIWKYEEYEYAVYSVYNIQCEFADGKIDWCKGSVNRPHTQTYFTFKISYRKKNSTCIFKFFIFIRLCSTVHLIFSVVSFVFVHYKQYIIDIILIYLVYMYNQKR